MPIPLYLVCFQFIFINGRLILTSFEEENVYHGIIQEYICFSEFGDLMMAVAIFCYAVTLPPA